MTGFQYHLMIIQKWLVFLLNRRVLAAWCHRIAFYLLVEHDSSGHPLPSTQQVLHCTHAPPPPRLCVWPTDMLTHGFRSAATRITCHYRLPQSWTLATSIYR